MAAPVKPNHSAPVWEPENAPGIAPPPVPQHPVPSTLPPGVHPNDPTPDAMWDNDNPVTQDTADGHGDAQRGRAPWGVDNDQALPIFQRASDSWDAGLIIVSNNIDPSQVVGRQKGRTGVTLWVPNTLVTPAGNVITTVPGVLVSPNKSELENPIPGGIQLNQGDSITIETEAPVYCALLPGQAIGYVQWMALSNPLGGHMAGY